MFQLHCKCTVENGMEMEFWSHSLNLLEDYKIRETYDGSSAERNIRSINLKWNSISNQNEILS